MSARLLTTQDRGAEATVSSGGEDSDPGRILSKRSFHSSCWQLCRSFAAYFRGFIFNLSQGVSTPWDPAEVTATCGSWVDQDTGWAIDGIALDSLLVDAEGVATIACRTYHLSAFSASEVAGESGLLSVFGTIPEDLNVLREVSKRRRLVLPEIWKAAIRTDREFAWWQTSGYCTSGFRSLVHACFLGSSAENAHATLGAYLSTTWRKRTTSLCFPRLMCHHRLSISDVSFPIRRTRVPSVNADLPCCSWAPEVWGGKLASHPVLEPGHSPFSWTCRILALEGEIGLVQSRIARVENDGWCSPSPPPHFCLMWKPHPQLHILWIFPLNSVVGCVDRAVQALTVGLRRTLIHLCLERTLRITFRAWPWA